MSRINIFCKISRIEMTQNGYPKNRGTNLFKIYKNCNGRRLSEMVTGKETGINYFEPQRKIDNKMQLTKKSKTSRFSKTMPLKVRRYSKGPLFQINQSPDMYTKIMCWKKLQNITKGRHQSKEFTASNFFNRTPQHQNPRL